MPTMPDVSGQNYAEAQQSLTNAGIYVPLPSYTFEPDQITIEWSNPSGVGGLVTAQSPASGASVAKGAAITLTLSAFPMAASIED